MAVWKQILVVLVLALAGAYAWATFDPAGRERLAGLGVPAWALPSPPANEAAEGGEGQGRPRGGQQAGGQGGGQQAGGGGRRGPGGPAPVTTAAAGEAITNDRVSAIGTAEADKTVTVFPRSTGMVDAVLFQSGERVEAGQVLVRLDADAEAIAMERANVTLGDARAKVERYDRLAANSSISSVERDAARSELASAELAVREARLALDRREVKSPFSGIIGLTDVEVGDMVSATSEIATIDDRSTLKVEFRIPEAFAAKAALNQTVTATTPSRPGETFEGMVSAIGSRIEADSRTLVVQARLDNSSDLLRPGMSFLVELRFDGDPRVSVPALSVQWDREGSYVWKVAEGKVARTSVAIVERNAEMVLVEGDLAKGDIVVVEGVQRLRQGATIADAAAATTPVADPAGATPTPAAGDGSSAPQAKRG
ncbi:efflux RND transporter periplasmic adaptor subunit [Chthonobacter albigriseus]|uniref:efflux RND transporter periplasmic adaptor subunit n=1 Tax=Chthonobacter albigriseus TaxID=1683161 RepID=UPI0015EFD6C8|nr:efflux RND transporter periplasmic adaptor subunit [Chthonobacter albigriseus]